VGKHAASPLCRERYTARDGNGRERLDIVRDRTGMVFRLIETRGNGTGMDLSQRDGKGMVMIVIPVSLSIAQCSCFNIPVDRTGAGLIPGFFVQYIHSQWLPDLSEPYTHSGPG